MNTANSLPANAATAPVEVDAERLLYDSAAVLRRIDAVARATCGVRSASDRRPYELAIEFDYVARVDGDRD